MSGDFTHIMQLLINLRVTPGRLDRNNTVLEVLRSHLSCVCLLEVWSHFSGFLPQVIVCLVSVWDLFLSRLGHLLVEESRCRDDLTRASGSAGRLGRGGVGGSTGMQRISAAWLLNGARWCARREAQYRCLHVTIACEGLVL